MSDYFEEKQLKKRESFAEKVNAAFVLKTSFTAFGVITDDQLEWIAFAYPNSKIERGTDQGASYYSVTPEF